MRKNDPVRMTGILIVIINNLQGNSSGMDEANNQANGLEQGCPAFQPH